MLSSSSRPVTFAAAGVVMAAALAVGAVAGIERGVVSGLVLAGAALAWLARRRELEQREAFGNLAEAMEQSPSAVMILDLDGRVHYANRSVCQLFGYARPQLLGSHWDDLPVTRPAGTSSAAILATVRADGKWESEWSRPRDDGREQILRAVVTAVQRRGGGLASYTAVFEDVTAARLRESELREARDQAEAGDRAKGQFLATMSHEVRTPLNGIAGFTSLLLETDLTEDQRDCVRTIKASTEALIQLTGDVLDFARIESGKLTLDPIACDPRECVEDALDAVAAKAAEKHVELLHRFGDDLPAAVVVDGARLRQVLVNLVSNAVKFTEKGEVEVSVRVRSDAQPTALPGTETQTELLPIAEPAPAGTCVLAFNVRDTGIGIAAEHQEKLFQPFTQVDESSTRRFGGAGLGLAISRSLVTLMGGNIGVSSRPGEGSSFTFTIRVPVAAAQPVLPSLRGMRVGLAIGSEGLRRELSVLVQKWEGESVELDLPPAATAIQCDTVVVECDEASARRILTNPGLVEGLSADTSLGLVPISLSNELRAELRAHFRLLVNKPVHHGALFALLSGTRSFLPPTAPPTRFGFRVLVIDADPTTGASVQRALSRLACTSTLTTSGHDALPLLARSPHEFDLVFLARRRAAAAADETDIVRALRAGEAGSDVQTIWVIALASDRPTTAEVDRERDGVNDTLAEPLKLADLEVALRRFRAERLARKH